MTFREWLLEETAAGIFFTDGKKVLLLKRKAPCSHANTWGLPGGHAKKGECAFQTAKREVTEECGTVKGRKFAEIKEGRWTCFFLEVDKPFECKLSDEHSEWKWIGFDDLDDYKLHPEFKKARNKYIQKVKTNLRSRG